jgi:hypothetical protein
VVRFLVWVISAALKPKALLVVRQQLLALHRRHPQSRLRNADRQFWICATQFASYCETRNGAEVASTGLTCLLGLALKSPAPEDW